MYFVVMPKVNLIVILMTCVCYIYSINCPTIICLPSMLLFILWRDTTSELWTPVQFPLHCYIVLLLLTLFTFTCILLPFYHSIRSILCLQQTGGIDNFIVSWEQSSWLCCVQVSRCYSVKTHQQYFWRHCTECRKASKHHLLKFGFLLLVR
jgi:hypothetical protein